jgi:SAM-dependent methyltransferase
VPLVNEAYWRARFGTAAPCWSGDRWVDWEHAIVVRSALRQIWPRKPVVWRVLDVGCGDGRWTAWMRDEFNVFVRGTDALEFPGVRQRLGDWFRKVDAEELLAAPEVAGFRPDLVVFLNSLTCVLNWRGALDQAARLAPRVLVFDNLMTPTPPWLKGLPHRRPIEQPELLFAAAKLGLYAVRVVTADVMHRRLFLRTPRWAHPVVAVVSAAIDLAAQRIVVPSQARHVAVLLGRVPERG